MSCSEVSDHRAPYLAAIGPAHVQKYASPSRLPQSAAPCDRLFRGYLTFMGLPRDRLRSEHINIGALLTRSGWFYYLYLPKVILDLTRSSIFASARGKNHGKILSDRDGRYWATISGSACSGANSPV